HFVLGDSPGVRIVGCASPVSDLGIRLLSVAGRALASIQRPYYERVCTRTDLCEIFCGSAKSRREPKQPSLAGRHRTCDGCFYGGKATAEWDCALPST